MMSNNVNDTIEFDIEDIFGRRSFRKLKEFELDEILLILLMMMKMNRFPVNLFLVNQRPKNRCPVNSLSASLSNACLKLKTQSTIQPQMKQHQINKRQ